MPEQKAAGLALTCALRAAACCSCDLLRAWLKGSLRKRVFLCTTCRGFLNSCSSSGTPGGESKARGIRGQARGRRAGPHGAVWAHTPVLTPPTDPPPPPPAALRIQTPGGPESRGQTHTLETSPPRKPCPMLTLWVVHEGVLGLVLPGLHSGLAALDRLVLG